MKYIEIDAAKSAMIAAFQEDVEMYGVEIPECFDAERANEILDALPAADVRPNVRGTWIKKHNPAYSPFDGSPEYSQICSRCGRAHEYIVNFCSHCGADMRGDTDGT